MRVKAQVAMVMNLDKCIGCHTCSVTCKQVWTNRPGTEYVWFNNVETKPGLGYPRRWEDQSQWRGGWELDRKGKLRLRAGGKAKKLLSIFANPDLPLIDDYYEPWTYDYQTRRTATPTRSRARTRSSPASRCRCSGARTGTRAWPAARRRRWTTRSWPTCRSRCG
jgi:nitrate reductase / nitrite oxidoreductase, beta subunit